MKIFFVDDEPLTLNYLKKILDWKSLNIEIMGCAENGKSALNQISGSLPDILITDIRMPITDGITLIDEIRKISDSVRIIVLSAYSDFEYARKVFSSGISGYLVKPIDEDKLLKLIEKIISELEIASAEADKQIFSQTLAAETLLWEQISKPNSNEIFYNKFAKLKSVPDLSGYQLLSFTFSKRSITREKILKSLYETAYFSTKSSSYLVRAGQSNWLMIIEKETGSAEIRETRKHLREQLDPSVYITVSALHNNPSSLPMAYNEILNLNAQRYYAADTSYIFYKKRKDINKNMNIRLTDTVEQYFKHIRSREIDKVNLYLTETDRKLIGKFGSDIKGYINFWTLFLILVHSRLKQYKENLQIPVQLLKFNRNSLQEFTDAAEIRSFINKISLEIMDTPASISGDSLISPIKNVKEFIHENFAEKLTLETISENFNMSKNYLCRIFHETAGCTLWDYLTMIRIEHAKQLLTQSGQNNAEIALQVGYDNQGYFSSVFKKKTGISPKKYRKNNQ